jgi:hypothetical protein
MPSIDWITATLSATIAAFVGGLGGTLASFFVTRYQIAHITMASTVDRACQNIYELEELGLKYWSRPHSSTESMLIKSLLKRVVTELKIISEFGGITHFRIYDSVIAFRQALTDGDFEVTTRNPDPQRTDRITGAANDLCFAVRRSARVSR